MAERRASTITISGNEYAKVAERLKLFREDCPRGKHESAYEVDVDGSLVFTVWLWKDKTDLLDLMKAGVTDKDILRSSADSNGTVKGKIASSKAKDFEILESNALGRALANLGYLASGEIASFEEMEEYERYREQQQLEMSEDVIEQIKATRGNLELNKVLQANSSLLKMPAVIAAAKAKQSEFAGTKS